LPTSAGDLDGDPCRSPRHSAAPAAAARGYAFPTYRLVVLAIAWSRARALLLMERTRLAP